MHFFVINAIIYGDLNPLRKSYIAYDKKAAAFAVLPDSLNKVEALLQRQLGGWVRFRFSNKGYPRKGGIVPGNDLPIVRYPFPPTVNWIFPAPDTPQLRFYDAVLKAELLRVELTLHRFSERARSDSATRKEVRKVLKSVVSYLKKVARCEDEIFNLLKLHLIRLYYEVVAAFGDVLEEEHYVSFDTLFFECFNRYPQGAEQYAFPAAQYVCRVQKYLLSPSKEVEQGKELLCGLYEVMANMPHDETLVAVTAALENFVFLATRKLAVPTFEEVTTPEFVRKVVRQQKKNLRRCCEIEETAIGRAILLGEIVEELLFDFPFRVDTDLSIVHRLIAFLEEERQIYLKKPDAAFKCIAKKRQKGIETFHAYVNRENRAANRLEEPSQEPGEERVEEQTAFPSAETYAMRLAVTKYKTFVDTVAFYRFNEMEKIKRLNADQRVRLIDRIVEMPIGYAVPMLKYLGYFDWLKKKYALSNTFTFKHLAKALSATERTVKGNYYVMNPSSNEDASRYNARYFMEKVVKDYEDIAKEGEGEGESEGESEGEGEGEGKGKGKGKGEGEGEGKGNRCIPFSGR